MGVVDFIRNSRMSVARQSEARVSKAPCSECSNNSERKSEAQNPEARKSVFDFEARQPEARKSIFARKSLVRKRGSLQDGTSVASWVKRMSIEEKAATFVAAVEDGGDGDESDTVVRARQRLSNMSAAEQHEVLTEILDTTSARAPSHRKTRLSHSGAAGVAGAAGAAGPLAGLEAAADAEQPSGAEHDVDGVVPFEASASLDSSRWASLASVEEETELLPAPLLYSMLHPVTPEEGVRRRRLDGGAGAAQGGAAAEGAARRSWKRCRAGVAVACYWQRCSLSAVLGRWKAALTADQLLRLQRLYALQVLSSCDSLARHQRYFKVADVAAVEVDNMYRPRTINPVGFRRTNTKPAPSQSLSKGVSKGDPRGAGRAAPFAPVAPAAAAAAKAKPARKRRSLIPNFRRSQVDPVRA